MKYSTNEIDRVRIGNILLSFIENKDIVLSKANNALIALNKVLGYWTDEQMKKGFYNLCYLEIVGDGIAPYELVFELIGYERALLY